MLFALENPEHSWKLGVLFVIAYLIGSIPFGLLLAKIFGYGDVRNIGSGNIGATNVLRTGNKALALATLFLDAAKGGFLIFITLGISPFHGYTAQPYCSGGECEYSVSFFESFNYGLSDIAMFMGLAAVIGHCYPVWLKFKGGKGVATSLGAMIAGIPVVGVLTIVIWIITAKIFRISSLAALTALVISIPLVLIFYTSGYDQYETAAIQTLLVLLIFFRHKENIQRLIKGEESKIGQKKEAV